MAPGLPGLRDHPILPLCQPELTMSTRPSPSTSIARSVSDARYVPYSLRCRTSWRFQVGFSYQASPEKMSGRPSLLKSAIAHVSLMPRSIGIVGGPPFFFRGGDRAPVARPGVEGVAWDRTPGAAHGKRKERAPARS